MFKKISAMVVAAMMAAMVLSSCGGKKQTLMEKIQAKGTIDVYTNPEFPPYEYLGTDGEISGSEIDLVKRIAQRLGVKANFVSSEFDTILMSVVQGKADMGASGFTINEERKQKVDFSVPFEVSVQYIIVPVGSPIKTIEDLAGKKVGGQQGTTGVLMLEDAVNKGILMDKGTEIKVYNTAPDAVVAMGEKKVEGVVIDKLVAMSLAAKNPGTVAFPLVSVDGKGLGEAEEFGIMLAKGNEDLMTIVNEVILEMKATGAIDELTLKHQEASVVK